MGRSSEFVGDDDVYVRQRAVKLRKNCYGVAAWRIFMVYGSFVLLFVLPRFNTGMCRHGHFLISIDDGEK